MYNKVFLIGRLVRDPEMRVTASGITVCRFTIAVDKGFKNIDRFSLDSSSKKYLKLLSEI